MIVIPPLEISSSILTSSTAFEVAPAAYSGATTYPAGAFASVAGSAGLIKVYKSLQASNTGNAPASSPTWWDEICDTYQEYSSGATYALDDYVIDAAAHRVCQSLVASNTGNALIDETKWNHIGTTNKWAMFDFDRSLGTFQAAPIEVSITPGKRINSLALLGVIGTSITITVTVAAVVVYTVTRSMTGRSTLSWYNYFFGEFDQIQSLLITDLPPYADAVITVLIDGTGVSCGACVLGNAIDIGNVLYGARSDGLNFSKIERDEFGNSVLVRRKTVPRTTQTLEVVKDRVNLVQSVKKQLNATPAVWSGLGSEDTDGYFESLLILGVYKQFEINIAEPSRALVNLELEEL
jgi:hypothetical protein